MKDKTILTAGIIGSAIAAICCATPILVMGPGAAGLSAWIASLDPVRIPALALFLGALVYGLWRRQRSAASSCAKTQTHQQGN